MRAFSSIVAALAATAGLLALQPLLQADRVGQRCIAAEIASAAGRRDACNAVLARHLLPEDRARALLYRGAATLNLEADAEALSDFANALEIMPSLAPARLNRSLVYLRRQDYEAALADLAVVFSAGGDLADAYAARGYVYFRQGDLAAAAADVAHLQTGDPDNAWAHNLSGAIHAQLGNLPKAAAEYRLAAALAPEDPGFADDASQFDLSQTP